jgi:His-Xaa-Ser system radical SAM maturase HxsB
MQSHTVNAAVDLVMQSPARHLTIEFQGGEPLLNFPVIGKIIERVELLAPEFDKKCSFVLMSNFTAMTEEKLAYLLQHKVAIGTSLDGPEALHDKNRPYYAKSSFAAVKFWTQKINQVYREKNIPRKVSALPTITRYSLSYPDAIVDTYIELGFSVLPVRNLSSLGRARQNWSEIGYSPAAFIKFYRQVLARIIAVNLAGVSFKEGFATLLVKKALAKVPINFMELRSPCGAAIGQMVYDWNGDIYTCDDGRMVGLAGDYSFRIGNVFSDSYRDCMQSDVTSRVVAASCIEAHPDCSDCVYSPFCGICPVNNYTQHDSLSGYMPSDYRCKIFKGMFAAVFDLLTAKDDRVRDIVIAWAGDPADYNG